AVAVVITVDELGRENFPVLLRKPGKRLVNVYRDRIDLGRTLSEDPVLQCLPNLIRGVAVITGEVVVVDPLDRSDLLRDTLQPREPRTTVQLLQLVHRSRGLRQADVHLLSQILFRSRLRPLERHRTGDELDILVEANKLLPYLFSFRHGK